MITNWHLRQHQKNRKQTTYHIHHRLCLLNDYFHWSEQQWQNENVKMRTEKNRKKRWKMNFTTKEMFPVECHSHRSVEKSPETITRHFDECEKKNIQQSTINLLFVEMGKTPFQVTRNREQCTHGFVYFLFMRLKENHFQLERRFNG